jgi:hypothetical protein
LTGAEFDTNGESSRAFDVIIDRTKKASAKASATPAAFIAATDAADFIRLGTSLVISSLSALPARDSTGPREGYLPLFFLDFSDFALVLALGLGGRAAGEDFFISSLNAFMPDARFLIIDGNRDAPNTTSATHTTKNISP